MGPVKKKQKIYSSHSVNLFVSLQVEKEVII